jgi:hypothetical protein
MTKLGEFYSNFSRIDLDSRGGYGRVTQVKTQGRADPKILAWLKQNCLVIPKFSQVIVYSRHPSQTVSLENQGTTSTTCLSRTDFLTLYLCP